MDQELDTLAQSTRALLALVRQLSQDNARLRSELAASQQASEALCDRMASARTHVESVLARLPVAAPANAPAQSDQES